MVNQSLGGALKRELAKTVCGRDHDRKVTMLGPQYHARLQSIRGVLGGTLLYIEDDRLRPRRSICSDSCRAGVSPSGRGSHFLGGTARL